MNAKESSFQKHYRVAAGISILLASLCFGAPGKDETELQQTYRSMDEAGKDLRTFIARFSQKEYIAMLEDFGTPETGDFYYARGKNGSVLMRKETKNPGSKIITIKGNRLTIYNPGIKEAQIINLGSFKNVPEYLTIGIGRSPATLEKDFHISYQGSESLNGEQCAILLLKPKSAEMAARYSSITLWIKKSNWLVVQNKLLEPNGDYILLTFTDETLNVEIPAATFEQKLPKDVEMF